MVDPAVDPTSQEVATAVGSISAIDTQQQRTKFERRLARTSDRPASINWGEVKDIIIQRNLATTGSAKLPTDIKSPQQRAIERGVTPTTDIPVTQQVPQQQLGITTTPGAVTIVSRGYAAKLEQARREQTLERPQTESPKSTSEIMPTGGFLELGVHRKSAGIFSPYASPPVPEDTKGFILTIPKETAPTPLNIFGRTEEAIEKFIRPVTTPTIELLKRAEKKFIPIIEKSKARDPAILRMGTIAGGGGLREGRTVVEEFERAPLRAGLIFGASAAISGGLAVIPRTVVGSALTSVVTKVPKVLRVGTGLGIKTALVLGGTAIVAQETVERASREQIGIQEAAERTIIRDVVPGIIGGLAGAKIGGTVGEKIRVAGLVKKAQEAPVTFQMSVAGERVGKTPTPGSPIQQLAFEQQIRQVAAVKVPGIRGEQAFRVDTKIRGKGLESEKLIVTEFGGKAKVTRIVPPLTGKEKPVIVPLRRGILVGAPISEETVSITQLGRVGVGKQSRLFLTTAELRVSGDVSKGLGLEKEVFATKRIMGKRFVREVVAQVSPAKGKIVYSPVKEMQKTKLRGVSALAFERLGTIEATPPLKTVLVRGKFVTEPPIVIVGRLRSETVSPVRFKKMLSEIKPLPFEPLRPEDVSQRVSAARNALAQRLGVVDVITQGPPVSSQLSQKPILISKPKPVPVSVGFPVSAIKQAVRAQVVAGIRAGTIGGEVVKQKVIPIIGSRSISKTVPGLATAKLLLQRPVQQPARSSIQQPMSALVRVPVQVPISIQQQIPIRVPQRVPVTTPVQIPIQIPLRVTLPVTIPIITPRPPPTPPPRPPPTISFGGIGGGGGSAQFPRPLRKARYSYPSTLLAAGLRLRTKGKDRGVPLTVTGLEVRRLIAGTRAPKRAAFGGFF